mmetsp:Transcript_37986/g.108933  ORF Transcript_37986/g.108933 Transcript_37986/m.108933 type:complete len:234 (-) Transcript_37986:138-839(-)
MLPIVRQRAPRLRGPGWLPRCALRRRPRRPIRLDAEHHRGEFVARRVGTREVLQPALRRNIVLPGERGGHVAAGARLQPLGPLDPGGATRGIAVHVLVLLVKLLLPRAIHISPEHHGVHLGLCDDVRGEHAQAPAFQHPRIRHHRIQLLRGHRACRKAGGCSSPAPRGGRRGGRRSIYGGPSSAPWRRPTSLLLNTSPSFRWRRQRPRWASFRGRPPPGRRSWPGLRHAAGQA